MDTQTLAPIIHPHPHSTLERLVASTQDIQAVVVPPSAGPDTSLDAQPAELSMAQEVVFPEDNKFVGAEAVLTTAMQEPSNQPEPLGEAAEARRYRLSKWGRVVIGEVFGVVYDVAAIKIGVPTAKREGLGGLMDNAIYGSALQAQDGQPAQEQQTKYKRVGKRIGHTAVNVAVAITAQKAGVGLVETLGPNLNHAVTQYVVPLTSKLAAYTGLGAARNRIAKS